MRGTGDQAQLFPQHHRAENGSGIWMVRLGGNEALVARELPMPFLGWGREPLDRHRGGSGEIRRQKPFDRVRTVRGARGRERRIAQGGLAYYEAGLYERRAKCFTFLSASWNEVSSFRATAEVWPRTSSTSAAGRSANGVWSADKGA